MVNFIVCKSIKLTPLQKEADLSFKKLYIFQKKKVRNGEKLDALKGKKKMLSKIFFSIIVCVLVRVPEKQ